MSPTRKRKKTAKVARRKTPRKWSKRVMERSNALDLEQGVFTQSSANAIAKSLKRSAGLFVREALRAEADRALAERLLAARRACLASAR